MTAPVAPSVDHREEGAAASREGAPCVPPTGLSAAANAAWREGWFRHTLDLPAADAATLEARVLLWWETRLAADSAAALVAHCRTDAWAQKVVANAHNRFMHFEAAMGTRADEAVVDVLCRAENNDAVSIEQFNQIATTRALARLRKAALEQAWLQLRPNG